MSKINEFMLEFYDMIESVPRTSHFRISQSYHLLLQSNLHISLRKVEYMQVVFIVNGISHHSINNTEIKLEKGDLLIIPAGINIQSSWSHSPNNEPHIISISFSWHDSATGKIKNPFSKNNWLHFNTSNPAWYESLFLQIFSEHQREIREKKMHTSDSMLHQILHRIYDESNRLQQGVIFDKRIEKVQNLIDAYPLKHYSIKELANISRLSERYFAKLFTKQVGVSPRKYQLQSRMRHARYLLEECMYSVKETAIALEYADPFIFSRRFKEITGLNPSTLKNKYTN
jgi:AraC-like DNA-binding protein